MHICFGFNGSALKLARLNRAHCDHILPFPQQNSEPSGYRGRIVSDVLMARRGSNSRGGKSVAPDRRARPPRRGDGRRPNRVGEMIRREMASIVNDAFATRTLSSGEQPLFVSVVNVRCSDDLRNARICVSVLGDDDQKKSAITWLKDNRRSLRYELAQCMRNLKYIPDLTFAESEVAEAVRTINIIDRLAQERREKETRARESGSGLNEWKDLTEDSSAELAMDAMAEDPFVDLEDDVVGFDSSTSRSEQAGDGAVDGAEDDDMIVDLSSDEDDEDDNDELDGLQDDEILTSFYNALPDVKNLRSGPNN